MMIHQINNKITPMKQIMKIMSIINMKKIMIKMKKTKIISNNIKIINKIHRNKKIP